MPLHPILPGSDSRANWTTINELIRDVAEIQRTLGIHRNALEKRHGIAVAEGLHWEGEWAINTAYTEGSVVTVTPGVGNGTYVATAAADGAPAIVMVENGGPWARLPGFGNGFWI